MQKERPNARRGGGNSYIEQSQAAEEKRQTLQAFLINLFLTVVLPPVGVLLYVTSGIAECSFTDICRKIWPFIAILVITVLLCMAFPGMVTLIPNSLM